MVSQKKVGAVTPGIGMGLARASHQGCFSTGHLVWPESFFPSFPHQNPFEVMDVFSTDDMFYFHSLPSIPPPPPPPSPGIMNPAWLACSGAFREGDDSVGLFLYLVRLRVSCQWMSFPEFREMALGNAVLSWLLLPAARRCFLGKVQLGLQSLSWAPP